MMTISEKLQIIKDNKDAIKQAILDKGGNVSGDFLTYVDAIKNISCNCDDNTSAQKKDVNFYDYDSTLLHSYSKDEFLSLSQLPELPTRDGLICQEWNYNLLDAKEYVEEYGVLDIGATYITDDGKTRLYISIVADGRMDVPLYFSQTVSNGVTIDWGDGSATQTISGTGNKNTTHTYNDIGDYVITLNPKSGCILGLGHNSSSYCVMGSSGVISGDNNAVYRNMLQKVEIGNGVTSIGDYVFYNCYSLSSIIIPNSITSIGTYAFSYCYSLSSIIIPNSITSIGTYAFSYCYSLSSIVIPNSVTSIGDYAFWWGYSLSPIIIPNSIISIGRNAFSQCYSLSSIVIPNSVTSIGDYAFQYCYILSSIVISNSVASIGAAIFQGCRSISSIVIPNSVTSIGYNAFRDCYSLSNIVIPNSVTNIGDYAFTNCLSLSNIVIPNSVTNIGDYAFSYCRGMAYCDFSQHTIIPTLAGTSVFSGINCKIIVPDSLYNSWKSATNWSNYASKIIKKSDWVVTETPGGVSGGSTGGSGGSDD